MDKSINLNPVGMSPSEAQLTQLYQLTLLKVLLYCSHYIVHVCQKLTRFYNLLYISSFFYYWKFSSHFFPLLGFLTVQKMKSSIMNFFRKRDQIRSFLRIWSNLLKKSLIKTSFFEQWCVHRTARIHTWRSRRITVKRFSPSSLHNRLQKKKKKCIKKITELDRKK